jgi:NADH-quinone oxidoreductase subunit L
MAAGSTLVASSGILLAYLMYYSKQISPEAMAARVSWLYRATTNKYYFDEIYENWITVKAFYLGLAQATDWVDRNIVNRVGETIGLIGRNLGNILSPIQTGQTQTYGAAAFLGVLLTVMAFMVWY